MPPYMGMFWDTYLHCRQSFLWHFTIEPNKVIVKNKTKNKQTWVSQSSWVLSKLFDWKSNMYVFDADPPGAEPQILSKQKHSHLHKSHLYKEQFREKGSMWVHRNKGWVRYTGCFVNIPAGNISWAVDPLVMAICMPFKMNSFISVAD